MSSDADSSSYSETISLSQSDGWIVAKDESTGVTSQGRTKSEALENLAEALELYEEEVPESDEPTNPSDAPWL
jgi:predicted RNase H-like HicB family nuclease